KINVAKMTKVVIKYAKLRLTSASSPPMPGPKIKPMPMDMPTSPMYLVRVSRVVISATILVVAVYSAPEAAPPSIRLMYNINKLYIKIQNMKKLNAKANSPYSKILRRPNLSLSLPKYGADRKLANE